MSATFLKHRENPRRGIPGLVLGPNPDCDAGFATERMPFGSLSIQDASHERGRYRLANDSDTIDSVRGVVGFTQLSEYPYDQARDPGILVDFSFDNYRKTKVWLPADTGLERGNLFYQISKEETRDVGKLYQTPSTTSSKSLDVTSILSLLIEESGDDIALFEIFVR